MLRRFALLIAFVVAGFAPVLAQTQAHPQHPPGQPHNPSHPPMDRALHAALHAKLMGNWSGTLTGLNATATRLQLAIASDKKGQMTIKTRTEGSVKAGGASDVAVDAKGLHWKQSLAGTNCKATAAVDAAAHHGADTMNGTMRCGSLEVTFTLQKTEG